MSIKDTMENVDWSRVGTDATSGAVGLVIGGPMGAVIGVGAAEAARATHSHLSGERQTGGADEGSEG